MAVKLVAVAVLAGGRGDLQEEAERAGGDGEAALKALIKRAIPDVMHLFNVTRATARYDYTAYPALPDPPWT